MTKRKTSTPIQRRPPTIAEKIRRARPIAEAVLAEYGIDRVDDTDDFPTLVAFIDPAAGGNVMADHAFFEQLAASAALNAEYAAYEERETTRWLADGEAKLFVGIAIGQIMSGGAK